MRMTKKEIQEKYPNQRLILYPVCRENGEIGFTSDEAVGTDSDQEQMLESLLTSKVWSLGAYSTLPEGMKIPAPVILVEEGEIETPELTAPE